MTNLPTENTDEWIDGRDFYELMQLYRHANQSEQEIVCNAFESVKSYIKANLPKPTEVVAQAVDVEAKWNKFICQMIDMGIGHKISYEHPSYRIVVSKEKQKTKDNGLNPNIIIIDDAPKAEQEVEIKPIYDAKDPEGNRKHIIEDMC